MASVPCGAFAGEHVELLNGMLVAISPQGSLHAAVVERLHEALVLALHGRARVRSHSPLSLSEHSEPEPDVAVVTMGDADFDAHPKTAWLVVEVADSSVQKVRDVKAKLYAAAGVTEYWIVVLPERVLELRDRPIGGQYQRIQTFGRGSSVRLGAFPDVEIQLDAVLPPR
jgi:Uma2 family endonuclease